MLFQNTFALYRPWTVMKVQCTSTMDATRIRKISRTAFGFRTLETEAISIISKRSTIVRNFALTHNKFIDRKKMQLNTTFPLNWLVWWRTWWFSWFARQLLSGNWSTQTWLWSGLCVDCGGRRRSRWLSALWGPSFGSSLGRGPSERSWSNWSLKMIKIGRIGIFYYQSTSLWMGSDLWNRAWSQHRTRWGSTCWTGTRRSNLQRIATFWNICAWIGQTINMNE